VSVRPPRARIAAPDDPDALAATWRAIGARWGAGAGIAFGSPDGSDRRTARAAAVSEAADAVGAPPRAPEHEADGRPCWPAGWTGSVSHRAGVTIALLRRAGPGVAVGVDVEETGALSVAEAALVLSPAELEDCRAAADPAAHATVTWSVKEAAFKAWSTVAGGLAGVDPLDIAVDWVGYEVVVAAVGPLARRVATPALVGDVRVGGPLTLAVVGTPASRGASAARGCSGVGDRR